MSQEDDNGGELAIFNTSREDWEDSGSEAGEEMVTYEHLPTEHATETKSYVYIDDFNAIETINVKDAPMHITTHRTSIETKAIKSERLFSRINNLADDIGM